MYLAFLGMSLSPIQCQHLVSDICLLAWERIGERCEVHVLIKKHFEVNTTDEG